jgi:DNA-binding transcriptional MerR regulator
MMTVHEVSRQTGVSIRALHHYDRIGLLPPSEVTEAGYRLYDDAALERLQSILLYKELGFPLKEIRGILESPVFDRNQALDQQITLLQMKKEHLENLIDLACGIKMIGVNKLDFAVFDTKKIDEYARQAKEAWGKTPAYREYKEKSAGRTSEKERRLGLDLMGILAGFGQIKESDPAGEEAQARVKELKAFITQNYYTCTDEILLGLGSMYAGGGEMTENINAAGGSGTAEYAGRAIEAYCGREQK